MAKKNKRGRGRPPVQKVFTAQELRQKAEAWRQHSQEHRAEVKFEEAGEALETILEDGKLELCNKFEIKALRRMAEALYDQYEADKHYKEDLTIGYGVFRDKDVNQVTPEEWEEYHAFLKKKRKNAKQTHNIYNLPESQRESKGLVNEPIRIELDIEATEKEIEERLFEAEKLKREQERQFLKGRRERRDSRHEREAKREYYRKFYR